MGSINCYVPNRSGDKIEIDMIMLCQKGIYVIENKNYSGWIFGDEKSKNWCEILKGKKYFFYNPIKQNKSHIKNLEKQLQVGDGKYVSLITFIGLCTDICVISNALLVKAALPEVPIIVDAACCAGVTPESHENALNAMKMCQIDIVG